MDERRIPAAAAVTLSFARTGMLALLALAGSWGGAFLTSATLARLLEARLLPAWLSLRPDGAPGIPWLVITTVGGIFIGLGSVALAARLTRRRGRAASERPAYALAPVPHEAPITPAESMAWLHVVSGPSARRVADAVAAITAGWIAGGERVLLIDGGPRLRLHGPLLAEPALGLAECLQDDVPLLGVVQCVGVPGLYLLVHGGPVPSRAWAGLGRLADAAHQHFDRVLLALDMGAPYEVGRALAGRYVEAWWSDPAPERRTGAQSLMERIGIRLRGMVLSVESRPMLESVRGRIETLRAAGAPRPEEIAVGDARPAGEPSPASRLGPLVLDCDLQVRERLRFLMWMRRVQRDERTGPAAAPARAATVPPITVSG